MKTKTIPFDLEMAMKIQSGEIEGRILQANGLSADILAYDINGSNLAVRFTREDGSEGVDVHQPNGKVQAEWCAGAEDFALVLEVSCTHIKSKHVSQFKPFDKVLVRDTGKGYWRTSFFSHTSGDWYVCTGNEWRQCIPYEGNEHLVGTTNNPK